MDLGSILTSSASGSVRRRPIETAPRTVMSWSGNSSRATSEAEIDRGARLVDHDHGYGRWQAELADEGLGLAGSGAVADGDGFDLMFLHQVANRLLGLERAVLALVGIDDVVVEQLALGIENNGLAAGAEARIDGQHSLLPQRRRQQELTEISG